MDRLPPLTSLELAPKPPPLAAPIPGEPPPAQPSTQGKGRSNDDFRQDGRRSRLQKPACICSPAVASIGALGQAEKVCSLNWALTARHGAAVLCGCGVVARRRGGCVHLWLVVPRGCTRVGLLHLLGVPRAGGRVALLLHRLLASGGATGTGGVRVLVVTKHDLWGGQATARRSAACLLAFIGRSAWRAFVLHLPTWEPPPGGARTRDDGLSVKKLPTFCVSNAWADGIDSADSAWSTPSQAHVDRTHLLATRARVVVHQAAVCHVGSGGACAE